MTTIGETKGAPAHSASKPEKGPEAFPSAPYPGLMATIVDDDERLLARIGYRQVTLGSALRLEALLTCSNRNYVDPLRNGQPSRTPSLFLES